MTVDKVKHTGIVGMRWGVRRGSSGPTSGSGKMASGSGESARPPIRRRSAAEMKQIHDARMKVVKEEVDGFLGREIGLKKLSDLKAMPRQKAIQHVTTVALAAYGAFKLTEFFAKKLYG